MNFSLRDQFIAVVVGTVCSLTLFAAIGWVEGYATPGMASNSVVQGSYHRYASSSCAWCGRTNELNVHHIKPQHLRPDLKDVPNNQITLCRECHFVLGHRCNWTNEVIMVHDMILVGLNTNTCIMISPRRETR